MKMATSFLSKNQEEGTENGQTLTASTIVGVVVYEPDSILWKKFLIGDLKKACYFFLLLLSWILGTVS
jgi:hypothetical protein